MQTDLKDDELDENLNRTDEELGENEYNLDTLSEMNRGKFD